MCLALCSGRAAAQYSYPMAVPYRPAAGSAPAAALDRPQPAADAGLRTAALQQPPPVMGGGPGGVGGLPPAEETASFLIHLEPPGPEALFGHLESEANLFQRFVQESRASSPPGVSVFPVEPVLSRKPYYGRRWPALCETAEPDYTCYQRLMYEQKNFERGGWDLGIITPVVSALDFYADFITSPYHRFTDVCRHYECSAGYCLPGDPTPLLLYPPEPSVTGTLAEVAAVAAVVAIFP